MTITTVNISDVYRMRITHFVDKLMQENWGFRERLDKTKVINDVTQSMQEKFTLQQFIAIKDSELQRRLGQRMAIVSMNGLITDFTQEQMTAFNDAVVRR
ncbi:MAG: hypothetical protein KAH77_09290 [Thiomargarita sp.]|nr:hypothetical protein [Thiomargarita sp.]